ncbi:MAG: GTPase domain-containing protein [Promethearchaeota archaeon]|nr:MAG: GTPase domain-containing protein [Candidatus Lokiarchaeota archaeon]
MMSQDQILCVTYFDQVIGPNTLYSSKPLSETSDAPDVNRILEFNDEEGTFIFAYRKFQTVNHIFYIDSDLARGGKELLMITYMIKTAIFKDEIVDVFKYLDSKAPVLEDFALEIKKLDEIASLLHLKKSSLSDDYVIELADEELKSSFLDIFNRYFIKLSPKYKLETPIRDKRLIKKIFIIGAPRVGKTTFLKNIELIQFLNIRKNDLPTRIYEVVIENLEILKYDEGISKFECKEYENLENCVNISQGFILLFNLSDKNSVIRTKEIFQIVDNTRLEMETELAPILLIGNKFYDKEDIEPEFVFKTFEVEELKELGIKIKYFPINILKEDEKVMEALRWLIKNII